MKHYILIKGKNAIFVLWGYFTGWNQLYSQYRKDHLEIVLNMPYSSVLTGDLLL